MKWQEVCERQDLHNLPFKVELNERGQILMTPVKVYHAAYQGKIAALLYLNMQDGEVLAECAIHTSQGTKVADVAWSSNERYARIKDEDECSIAPEICVEILSESNTSQEIATKRQLYFEQGAREVWICDRKGSIVFYDPANRLEKSGLAAKFPNQLPDTSTTF